MSGEPSLELTLRVIERTDIVDGFDREMVCYTPVLANRRGHPVCSGELSFATWTRFKEEPEEHHEEARREALANAREIIAEMGEAMKGAIEESVIQTKDWEDVEPLIERAASEFAGQQVRKGVSP